MEARAQGTMTVGVYLNVAIPLRSRQVACVESIDERSEEPTFTHRLTAKAVV